MKRIFLLTFCLLTVCALHADETTVKVRKAVGRWEVSGDLSMAEAEERALNEAKKDALSKAGVMENVWSVFGQVTSAPPTCWNRKAALGTVWKLPFFAGIIVNISITACRIV